MDFALMGINAGLKAARTANPTGYDGLCTVGEIVCQMGSAVFSRIKDGNLTDEEFNAIQKEFLMELPSGLQKEATDLFWKVFGGLFKL